MICDGQTLVCIVSDFLSFHSLVPALQKAYYCVKVEKLYNATLNKGFREDSFCFFKSTVAVFRFSINFSSLCIWYSSKMLLFAI